VDKAGDYMELVQKVLKETDTEKQVVYKAWNTYQSVRKQYGKLLDNIIYMPVVSDRTKDYEILIDDFLRLYHPTAIEIIFQTEASPLLTRIEAIKKAHCRVWINALWADQNAGHNDERAIDEPEETWGWLLRQGADIIQTDRPKELIEYLKSKDKRNENK
jgi:glycerophosphoryl diester phosphodiesterase